ncbi:peptidase S8/S53 domain-containing protein [Gloeopeniophorella convolvens]|nr:peptidase S8/S53 domain-containing protein [Gloeopeniophorella convolvens]
MNEPYSDWLDFVLKPKTIPQTISTSYGDGGQTVPEDYEKHGCAGFAQPGGRGVSLTVSSGDGGVGDGDPDPVTQQCFSNDDNSQTKFLAGFPASCPLCVPNRLRPALPVINTNLCSVTAIGGTIHIPEVLADFSRIGFSEYFPHPSWQDAAVEDFLNELPEGTYAGLFNASGCVRTIVSSYPGVPRRPRAQVYPDVSAQSYNFRVFVSLLNDARLSAGLPSLGLLNPLIYSLEGAGFNDITVGNAPGCGTPGFNVRTARLVPLSCGLGC